MRRNVTYAVDRLPAGACRIVAAVLFAAGCLLLQPGAARGAVPPIDQVEKAVLAADAGSGSLRENWHPVVRLLADVTVQTDNPVLRMIKGHACLAANENNEAVCLFLSVQVPEDKKAWLEWAERFAKSYDNSPIAHYFHGDALARLGQWDDAISNFSRAVDASKDKRHVLARNARCVVYTQLGKYKEAFEDAIAATHSQLADAFANIGALSIAQAEGAQSALQDFDKAIELAKASGQVFAIALYGRGCILDVLGRHDEASKDRDQAFAAARCARGDLAALFEADHQRLKRELAQATHALSPSDLAKARMAIQQDINFILKENHTLTHRQDRFRSMIQAAKDSGTLTESINEFYGALNDRDVRPEVRRNLGRVVEPGLRHMNIDLDKLTRERSRNWDVGGDLNSYGGGFKGSLGGSNTETETFKNNGPPKLRDDGFRALQSTAKGITTRPERPQWDSGDWPFTPVHMLWYRPSDRWGAALHTDG